mgnify:CR=1 FL=1
MDFTGIMVKYIFCAFSFFSRAKEKLQDIELQGQQLRVSDILDKILVTLPRSEGDHPPSGHVRTLI